MLNLVYIGSSSFDYSKLICADAGPEYAARLGIQTCPVSHYVERAGDVLLIDTRLDVEEIEIVRRLAFNGRRILFRAHDPCFFPEGGKPLTKLIFECVKLPEIGLVLTYTPKELTALMEIVYGANRVFHLPYPYMNSLEQVPPLRRRKQIIISGALDPAVYPLRSLALRKRRTSLSWRLLSKVLQHPGYLDIDPRASDAGCRGSNYVALLARFQFMFLCPSRAKLELLKYNECAYALCCPVGEPAESLPSEAKAAFLQFDFGSWQKCIQSMREISEAETLDRAIKFRAALKAARQPGDLLAGLKSWIAQFYGTTLAG